MNAYKVCGKQGLEDATYQAVGELAANNAVHKEVSKTSIGRKFAGTLLFILATIGGVNDALQLVDQAPKFLADMSDVQEQKVTDVAAEEEIISEDHK